MRTRPVAVLLLSAWAAVAAAAEDGKALYQTKCAMCHGKDGVAKSTAAGSRNLNDPAFQSAVSAAEIAAVIEQGKNKMPPNKGRLTPPQVEAIVAHVKTLAPPPKK